MTPISGWFSIFLVNKEITEKQKKLTKLRNNESDVIHIGT